MTHHPHRVVTTELCYPEGPVWLEDGSVIVVEVRGGTLTRVHPDGRKQLVAQPGGGPNGIAVGADGYLYVCNNGGLNWVERAGMILPHGVPADYRGGRIERIDPSTGKVDLLYDQVNGVPLKGPNDIVCDAHGGFWFTDFGKVRERDADRGGLYYAKCDGSLVREVVYPLVTPNGVGLSPDGRNVYVAETDSARLWAWSIGAPGEIVPEAWPASPNGGRLLYASPDYVRFDSLGVEADGNICVGTLVKGGISVVSPQGGLVEFIAVSGEIFPTNLCFGGPGMKKAYITCSGRGELAELDWPRAGVTLYNKVRGG